MKRSIKLTLSTAYMSDCYDEFRRYGSKWLLVEKVVGLGFVLGGLALYTYAHGVTALPLALMAIGAFELLSNRVKKFFWLRRHAKSKLADATVEIEFSDDGIRSTGPYSSGTFQWSGLEKAKRTHSGIIIWPQKGMYWYIPESEAGSELIAYIQRMAA
jgi:hypothetical protein